MSSEIENVESVIYGPNRLILSLVAFLIAGVSIASFVFAKREDTYSRIIGAPANFSSRGSIDSLTTLFEEPVAGNLVGRDIELTGALVESVVGDYVFWLGDGHERRVAVVLLGELLSRQKERLVEVRTGERLIISGTVRKMRDFQRFGDKLIDTKEAQALAEQKIFIAAFQVTVLD